MTLFRILCHRCQCTRGSSLSLAAHFYGFFVFRWRNRVRATLAEKSIFRVFEFAWAVVNRVGRSFILGLLEYILGTYNWVRLPQRRWCTRRTQCILYIKLLFVKFLLLNFVPFGIAFLLFRVRVCHYLLNEILNARSLYLFRRQVLVMVPVNAVDGPGNFLRERLFEWSAPRNAYSKLGVVYVPKNFDVVVEATVASF